MLSKSIQRSIQIGIKRPGLGTALLARNLTKCINDTALITSDLKIEFCLLLLKQIIYKSYKNQDVMQLSNTLQDKSIYFRIHLLKRYPKQGIEVLVNLVIHELTSNQKYSQDELLVFYNEVFNRFFPDY